MKKLVSTKNLTTEEWLTYRRMGIGGSDASVVMGINPYRSIYSLWEDKCSLSPVSEHETSYTYFGHVLEPIVRMEFMKRTGLKVRIRNAIFQSEDYPWMIANLDGIVTELDGSHAIFEAKTASEYKKSVWEEGVPEEYYAQLQHYMAVTGLNKAYIAAIVGGNSFYHHIVERDEAYISELIVKEADFWNHVVLKTRPEPDGSEATATYLSEKYSKSVKNKIQLPGNAEVMITEYKKVEEEMKLLKSKKTELSNHLKTMLENNEIGIAGDSIVRWSSVEKATWNSEKLKAQLGDSVEDYLTRTKYRKFSVA